MKQQPHLFLSLKGELSDWQQWQTRIVVLVFALLSGLTVVCFTFLTETALHQFREWNGQWWWMALLWTPLCTGMIVWITRKWFQGAAGSGIPQVMAAMDSRTPVGLRARFVSVKLSIAKICLSSWGLLSGLSLGREGPSVQIAAGVMHAARRWMPARGAVSDHGLLTAGGAAGIAAAFNTPLGGIMFAIEELSRKPEQRNNGLVVMAIVLAGVVGISFFGNSAYFGVIHTATPDRSLLLPGLLLAVLCGLVGGLFSRLLIASISGVSKSRLSQLRSRFPVRFAVACGFVVALIGVVSNGATFGSGYAHTKGLLDNETEINQLYVLLKFMATWITTWSGVPGGIFAPSLAIGAGLGADVSQWTGYANAPTLIALGMAGFLAAVTQAPLTAFIIVMEMVDGYNLVFSLMACSVVAKGVSRMVSRPLYTELTDLMVQALVPPPPPSPPSEAPLSSVHETNHSRH